MTEGGVIFLAVYVGITAVGGLVHERLKVIGEACLEDLHNAATASGTAALLLLPFYQCYVIRPSSLFQQVVKRV